MMKDKNEILNNFVEELKKTYTQKLFSVVVYGSCADNLCENKYSDINCIVLINNLDAEDLKQSNNIIKNWKKDNDNLPIFMDKEEWFNSADVYPIEYSDIKDRYRIVFGEDVVATLQLTNSNLRLMCEHEIKNILIKLRQYYLANSSKLDNAEKVALSATKSLIAVFRAVLKIHNDRVPHQAEEVIDLLAENIDFDKETFKKLLKSRKEKISIRKSDYEQIIQSLINSTNKILSAVDKI